MARKNQHPKTAARGRKAPDGKPRAGREGVAKTKTAAKAPAKRAPAPASPPAAKVKFRGRVLENEPLARYTTYRIGGAAAAPGLAAPPPRGGRGPDPGARPRGRRSGVGPCSR